MATEPKHDPVFRTVDLSAEARRIWGPTWHSPEDDFEFSNKRKFQMRTQDSGIYGAHSSGESLLQATSYERRASGGPSESYRIRLMQGGLLLRA